MPAGGLHRRDEEVHHAVFEWRGAVPHGLECVGLAHELAEHDRAQERALAGVVAVHGHPRASGRRGDLIDGGGTHAVAHEQVASGVCDALGRRELGLLVHVLVLSRRQAPAAPPDRCALQTGLYVTLVLAGRKRPAAISDP
ncbi:hypothetical protein LRS13_03290 [Svornostia abyssi]|uniref:Uncharacterized protein n=1 Tax=Svornostia abyssi TaxID=2898438 RepID=A0ABY5PIS5_9ACTN|nr:hypothetical protein LRS13_03290 [Parviterribacteraceae bacterium J379]